MRVCAFASGDCSSVLRPLTPNARRHAWELASDFDKNANHICSKHYLRLYRKLNPRPEGPAFHRDERSLPPSPTFVLGLNPDVRVQLKIGFIFNRHISIYIFSLLKYDAVPLSFILKVSFLPVFSPQPACTNEFLFF